MKRFRLLLLAPLLTFCGQAQQITGTWSGQLDAGPVKLNLVFHFEKDANGNNICKMDSPDQSMKGIPAGVQHLSADSVSLSIPAAGISYTARLHDAVLKGTFSQMGRNFPLQLKHEGIHYDRPQTPAKPYPYTTEEVTFDNPDAGAVLAGTLTYPTNYRKGEKVPVVLMVTGSGPQNRDEEIFEHKPFLIIADYLARHGIATLRYDDRKVGQSTGKNYTMTTREVADDAQKGIEFLRKKGIFSKVGLLGHSEGGCVAFMLGSQKLLDFAVSFAGCGAKGSEVTYSQAKLLSEQAGQPFPYTCEQFTETVRRQNNPWLNYFLDYDPMKDIQQTQCPVFALNGEKDMQVIASLNLPNIEKNLPKNPKNRTKLYPGLNHLFQPCTTGMPTEYAQIATTISPEVLKDVADWINGL